MSAFSRWTIAVFCILGTIGLVVVCISSGVEPGQQRAFGVLGVFLMLIAVACFPGPGRAVAVRLLGATVFAVCVGYIFTESRHPLPAIQNYRRSEPNPINAVIAFLLFGLPGGYVALWGKFPRWTILRDKLHAPGRDQ